jgi:hypothetical protein
LEIFAARKIAGDRYPAENPAIQTSGSEKDPELLAVSIIDDRVKEHERNFSPDFKGSSPPPLFTIRRLFPDPDPCQR